ncbi:ribosomal biogenesis protein LAS1L-like [Spodoptera frugiperda]|uniref:Ribosomal biogenesis protein LAS1L-like n=1 Tax=Spodoptera frugiperda TaxID=7108 RepID=A0A9R0F0F3_SPOFR|nr:ribosomal biogenesis protein LAS1L-like [Spodoptera frugiperda]
MYFIGVLCLLLAVEALPTPEQLHTNVPAVPSSSELKPDEKDKIEEPLVDPVPPVVEEPSYLDQENKEKFEEPKKEPEAEEKPKEEEEKEKEKVENKEVEKEKEEEKEVKDKFEDVVVVEESNDAKDKPKEEEPKEEKKDDEAKDDEEEGPIIVQILKPKPFLADLFSQFFPGFQWPHFSLPDFLRPKSADPLELDEPVYIVKESDFSWPYKK